MNIIHNNPFIRQFAKNDERFLFLSILFNKKRCIIVKIINFNELVAINVLEITATGKEIFAPIK